MVAGTHGAEEVTAELLFVLCKENGVLYAIYTSWLKGLVCTVQIEAKESDRLSKVALT